MNAIELIEKWPGWTEATPTEIFGSEAWAMPVSYRGSEAVLVKDAVRERDVIGLDIRLDDEQHFLALAVSDDYPELSKVWEAKAKLPDEILLALVEKECGALFQTLENAVRRQLSVKGLADREQAKALNAKAQAFAIRDGDGTTVCDFSLSMSEPVVATFGRLSNLDFGHSAIRGLTRPARAKYAEFFLDEADVAGLAPGDRLLLPEIETKPAQWMFDDPKDNLLHVLGAGETEIAFGALADDCPPELPPATELELRFRGRTVAVGRLARLGEQPAFEIEEILKG